MINVKALIKLLEDVPENFKNSEVYIDDRAFQKASLDMEHGEYNLYSSKIDQKTIEVPAEVLVALLSTSHPNGKILFDYRGVAADVLEDIFYQALSKMTKKAQK